MISEAEIPPPETETAAAPVVPDILELAVTTGMSQFAGVGDGRKLQILSNGVRFLGKMTEEQWFEALASWKRVYEIFHFGLADIINYGREKFSQEKVDAALQQLSFDLSDIARADAIGQTLLQFRLPSLTSEHYYVLGRELAESQKEQAKWAVLADKFSLTAFELKKSIEAGKVIKQETINSVSGHNSGITNIEGISNMFDRWERQAGGEEKILNEWSRDLKLRWLEKVNPIVELAQKVKATLEAK